MRRDSAKELGEIYDELFRGVYGYCAYRLFSRDLAEDVACAVFLRLVEKYPGLKDRPRVEIRNWLYGTARNVITAHLRDTRRRRKIAAELARQKKGALAQGAPGDGQLDWPALYEAISELTLSDQEIIAMRFFRGLDTSAIAGALGIRHGTARVRLSRAVRRLQPKVGKHNGET